jgi:hypothetical protein
MPALLHEDRIPISLLIDDPCPLIHVYRDHWVDVHGKSPLTDDGRPLLEIIPNDFLDRYCDVMERWEIKGKFSIVPAPAGKGDIIRGIEGFDRSITQDWLDTAKTRLSSLCDFCPEGITHNLAVDLSDDGRWAIDESISSSIMDRSTSDWKFFPEGESHWSQHQTRETLTPYLTAELEYLKRAGFDCTGVTSPWVFGIEVEEEYIASIVAAQKAVYGRDFSWYFLHMLWSKPETRPWIAYQDNGTTLVAIAATVKDWWWDTINSPRTDREWINSIADKMLTADGKSGQIIDVLDAGGWPVVLTHWQSLFSNGLETGLVVLDELGKRVNEHLAERVEWMKCSEVAEVVGRDRP